MRGRLKCAVGVVGRVFHSANGIGGAGAASIAEALKLNTTITSVNLHCECPACAGVFARAVV